MVKTLSEKAFQLSSWLDARMLTQQQFFDWSFDFFLDVTKIKHLGWMPSLSSEEAVRLAAKEQSLLVDQWCGVVFLYLRNH
jgi:hypothetical protein